MQLLPLVICAAISLAAPDAEPASALMRSRDPAVDRAHGALAKLDRRVRTVDARVRAALFDGVARSRTLASLVDALDRSDVITYVEVRHELPRAAQGRILIASRGRTGERYLRIQLRATLAKDELISILGHELQHALEIAGTPEVRDEATLRRFYERVGAGMSDGRGFDTEAARVAGDRVKRELRDKPHA